MILGIDPIYWILVGFLFMLVMFAMIGYIVAKMYQSLRTIAAASQQAAISSHAMNKKMADVALFSSESNLNTEQILKEFYAARNTTGSLPAITGTFSPHPASLGSDEPTGKFSTVHYPYGGGGGSR